MQYQLRDIIDERHIRVNVQAQDARESIQILTDLLVDTGHVTPEFAQDVWQREEKYPTGLPTEPVAVAIPHADPDHVNQSGICFGILSDPVPYAQMGTDGSIKVQAKIVILLAVKEKEKQVTMIQQLMEIVQNRDLLEKLLDVSHPREALPILRDGT